MQRLSINLSRASEKLPSSLLLRGVIISNNSYVGGGGFADIFIGQYAHQEVALKRLRIFRCPQETVRIKKMFFREALIWHRLKHARVLPFLGMDVESFGPHICIVAPWMANRDIMTYMDRNGLGSLDTHRVLTEVSEGLQYLHKQNVVHGDLRGENIFLDDFCHVLLADFGLTNFADATNVATTEHHEGSTRWMSPELHFPKKFGMPFRRTFASDVYAFGCVCLEVLTGQQPSSEFPQVGELLMELSTSKSTIQPTRPNLGECFRQVILDRLWPLIILCVARYPGDRHSTLCDCGSLLDLVTTAGIETTEPEVEIPTLFTQLSRAVADTSALQWFTRRQADSVLAHYGSGGSFGSSVLPAVIAAENHETLVPGLDFRNVICINPVDSSGAVTTLEWLSAWSSPHDTRPHHGGSIREEPSEKSLLRCEVCDVSFPPWSMIEHKWCHTLTFFCDTCHKSFHTKSDHRRHVRYSHGDLDSMRSQPPSPMSIDPWPPAVEK
ncbi:hypothetical protein JAAARDRAFT_39589 [Jaapia argillacea MUCL 33604]|uniref:Uncharacterized protein n=1 Tax=Jaapia argillacea MUCL 33604 TaxID=933084 RepID=A0A067PE72_9AGAM|nr:hypothetical protein JAAARDRAFT_39589 [Jaapia argillacea MUCL 33604]